jgi:septal ring factor EnvC (AmiA/AmiB activator)
VRVVGFEDAGPPRGLCVVVRPVYRDPPVARPKGEETLVRIERFRVAYRHLNKEELKTMAATKKDKPTAKSDEARRLREEQAAQREARAAKAETAAKLGGPKGAKKG